MKISIMKRLIRTYYEETLGEPKNFPYWGELCDICEKGENPKDKFYELLGYSPHEGYSASKIYEIRKQDAKRNYKELLKTYKYKNVDQLSSFISKIGARATLLKKGRIPSELWDEVAVLSEYIKMDDNLLVQFNEEYIPVGSLLTGFFPTLGDLESIVKKLSPIILNSIRFEVSTDPVKCFNSIVYTRTEFTDKQKEEVVRFALISSVIPYLYMDTRRAFLLYRDKGLYQMVDKDETYLQYLDHLHHSDVTMPEVFKTIGLEYYSALDVYNNLKVIAQKQNEEIIMVTNELSENILLSPEEFTWAREKGYLEDLVNTKDGVKVGPMNATLAMLRGVSFN